MIQIHNETQIFNAQVVVNGDVLFAQPFSPPSLTTAQRNLLPYPREGWLIFNTTLSKHQAYAGGTWVNLY